MYLFFEEDGQHKAAVILKHEGNAYQVEFASGKRTKVKGGHVFFEFDHAGGDFLEQAKRVAEELDPAFLWEACPGDEVEYGALAREYFGSPTPVEMAATLLALHANPVYFYRKGRGVFKPAPKETLDRALQALKRREALEAQKKEMVDALLTGEVPEEIASNGLALLLKPDKNSIEYKALNEAASAARETPLRLLLRTKGIRSSYAWHVDGFYFTQFPNGRGFPRSLPKPELPQLELPQAQVQAFSIDDSATTEIDDATSIERLGNGRLRIGIHIAAPALFIERDSAVDKIARERLSTVYAPGIRTTMLPSDWIEAASLKAGRAVPCLSLYTTVQEETMSVVSTETYLENVTLQANLRYDKFDEDVTEEALMAGTLKLPYAEQIALLWRFAKARQHDREQMRGKPESAPREEFYFVLEGENEQAHATLKSRVRGAPIDLIVSELMIFANMTWGLWLEEHHMAAIYRSQRMGRVRMSTTPGPHDGLGVVCYAWSTSPLRRYVDLVNQRQIVCAVLGQRPAYEAKDTDLYTGVTAFESAYDAYNEFQRRMERYWSLRWIEQEGKTEVSALVVKDELVRFEGLPCMQRIPGLPSLERGRRIRLQVLGCDYVELVLETRLAAVLDEAGFVEEMPEEKPEPDAAQEGDEGQPETSAGTAT